MRCYPSDKLCSQFHHRSHNLQVIKLPVIRFSGWKLQLVHCQSSRAGLHRYVHLISTMQAMFNFTADMWTDFPWQFWFFATPVGTQVGTNKILPNYMPVVMYVLNDTKKENMHFRFLWRKTCDLCLVMAKLKTLHLKNITLSTHLWVHSVNRTGRYLSWFWK